MYNTEIVDHDIRSIIYLISEYLYKHFKYQIQILMVKTEIKLLASKSVHFCKVIIMNPPLKQNFRYFGKSFKAFCLNAVEIDLASVS